MARLGYSNFSARAWWHEMAEFLKYCEENPLDTAEKRERAAEQFDQILTRCEAAGMDVFMQM